MSRRKSAEAERLNVHLPPTTCRRIEALAHALSRPGARVSKRDATELLLTRGFAHLTRTERSALDAAEALGGT